MAAFNIQTEVAGAIARRAPEGALSARDIDDLIAATSDAQGKLAFVERLLQFEELALQKVQ